MVQVKRNNGKIYITGDDTNSLLFGGIGILISPLVFALAMRYTMVGIILIICLLALLIIYRTSKFRIILSHDSVIIEKQTFGLTFLSRKFLFAGISFDEKNDINFVRGTNSLSFRFERKCFDTVEIEVDSKYQSIGNEKNSAEIMRVLREEIRTIDHNAR
jgi:hypothetical protein